MEWQNNIGTCKWKFDESQGRLTIAPTDGHSGVLNCYYPSPWGSFKNDIVIVDIQPGVKASATENSLNMLFGDFSNLKQIVNLFNLDTSNATGMTLMFLRCESLIALDLSGFNTSNVTDMGGMFDQCSSLISLNLSSFNTSNVNTMTDMFVGCTSITSLDLSSFNTSNVTEMRRMFFHCTSLTSIDLSSFDMSKVKNMDNMFDNCVSLKTIVLPKTVGYSAKSMLKTALQRNYQTKPEIIYR